MKRTRTPLDTYDIIPEEQRAYLLNYGKHFNRKAYEYAVGQMTNAKGEKMTPEPKETIEAKLKEHGITLENNTLYDAAFVFEMAKSDFMGSSLEDEKHLLLYVKDLIDDPDQADGFIFNRWYADQVNKGEPIEWGDLL